MNGFDLSDDPVIALEQIGSYLSAVSIEPERKVVEIDGCFCDNHDELIESGCQKEEVVVGYWQTTEYTQDLVLLAKEALKLSKHLKEKDKVKEMVLSG